MKTREGWLTQMADGIYQEILKPHNVILPKYQVSCSFPPKYGLGKRYRVFAQYWPGIFSINNIAQIFISPMVFESIQVGIILCHELIHAAVGVREGHKGKFKTLAKSIDLHVDRLYNTASPILITKLQRIIKRLGKYPHSMMFTIELNNIKRNGMLKVWCPSCGYIVRTSSKWLKQGIPTCHCGSRMVKN